MMKVPKYLFGAMAVIVFFGAFSAIEKVRAEVVNPSSVMFTIDSCEGYLSFLEGEDTVTPDGCHEIAHFQISNRDEKNRPYLRRMLRDAGGNTALGALAEAVLAVIQSDASEIYSASDGASRLITIKMARSGDIERAVLYSHLLSEMQRLSVQAMCSEELCDSLQSVSSMEKIMGEAFSELDTIRSDFVLYCLLKTDAFLIPVRKVLESRAFVDCVH